MIYCKDIESSAVVEAKADKERLEELGICSPDVSMMYKLKFDNQTIFYFETKRKRDVFISKYYNRNTKQFNIDKTINDNE